MAANSRPEGLIDEGQAAIDAHPASSDTEPSMPLIKVLIIACLIAILVSLGSGMFHLVKDKGGSKKMVNALTVRVALSVALFILLFIAWSQGLLQPHGIGQ